MVHAVTAPPPTFIYPTVSFEPGYMVGEVPQLVSVGAAPDH